jgi:tRNA uracil 4-sulfurtransferase
MNYIVVRYSELALKGKNRHWFEDTLIRNIKKHLAEFEWTKVSKIYGRIIVETKGSADKAVSILKYIPGIANFSLAVPSTHDLEEIGKIAVELFGKQIPSQASSPLQFKVSTRRSSKEISKNSQEISALIGGKILEAFSDLKVNLTQPEVELGIEIWSKNRSILYLEKIQGQGGLPSGTSGSVMSFISGGIDSPVASWFMMKRGCNTSYIHFHSYPFIGEQSRQKVIDLVTHLSRFQPKSVLYVVPFATIQKAIKESCEEKHRTILYRRVMFMIAEELKNKYKIQAYVTGEAVGQVASQTLENLACTQAASSIPILRPLIGMDKSEITVLAKKIGTYEISIQPFDDCCTVFQPRKPEIHGKLEAVQKDEENIDFSPLIHEAIENTEVLRFKTSVINKFWD